MASAPKLAPAPEPAEYTCPCCLNYNRMQPGEAQQRCTACGEYTNTWVLIEDHWAL